MWTIWSFWVELQAALVVDRVVVVEAVEEDVHHRDASTEVDMPLAAAEHQRPPFHLVALRSEEIDHLAAVLPIGGIVDVGEHALPEPFHTPVEGDVIRKVQMKRNRAHDPEDQPLLLGFEGEALRLLQIGVGRGVFIERDISRKAELRRSHSRPTSTGSQPDVKM
jgi:hypothetical protein